MGFDVAAEAYDRFMGRYSRLLAPQLADLAEVRSGQRALDVGSGPGALTSELVARLGAESVTAVDPSTPFVEAARARHPGVEVHQASAEALPFADGAFDVAIAQLVVHFMADPVTGLGEMRRVVRHDGIVAASVWDLAGGRAPLSVFWRAARQLNPDALDESLMNGAREGHLRELFVAAGLRDVLQTELAVSLEHPTFDEWWEPYRGGVGPAGAYVAGLRADEQADLRERCRALLPDAPFVMTSYAWAARGVV
jgi:SAM-dependent methyltransferase